MKFNIIKYIPFLFLAVLPFVGNGQQKKLSLAEAINLAGVSNAEIKSSQLEIEKSGQQRIVSRSSLLPTVSAQGSVNHYFQLPAFFGFGQTNEGDKIPYGRFGGDDQLGASITAIQPLYNPQAYPLVRRSRLQEEESRTLLHSKQIEIASAVQQTYLTILVLEQRIQLQEESIVRNKRVLKDAQSLFAQGKALRVDTLRAYTSVKNLEPTLLQLLFAAETQRLHLKTLIGIDSAETIALTDSLVIPATSSIPGEADLYQIAKTANPDYQALRLREEIGLQSVQVASALRKPVVSAIALYQVQSQTNHLNYDKAYYPTSSLVGLQVSVPLFAGFGNQARLKQAYATQQQSSLARTYSEDNLRSRVHQVIAATQESSARLKNTSIVRETAQLSYTIIQYRYKAGIASRLELNDAEFALSTAQSNYLEAVYDYLNAQIELNKLMGKAGNS